jgi:hypothetical protein
MNNNNNSNQEIGRGEKIHIYISGVILLTLLILFGGIFGYFFYMGLWIASD